MNVKIRFISIGLIKDLNNLNMFNLSKAISVKKQVFSVNHIIS